MNFKETIIYRINQHKLEIEFCKKRFEDWSSDYLQGRIDALEYAIKEYERN